MTDWIEIIALLAGPVIGVYIAEHLAKHKSKSERKHAMFRALLANRANPIHLARVEAINLIPYEFQNQNKVLTAWRTYISSTNVNPQNDEESRRFGKTMNDNYDSLLFEIVKALNIGIEQRDILQGGYTPDGLNSLLNLEIEARQGLSKLGKGEIVITTKSEAN